MNFSNAAHAWGTPTFDSVLKREVEALPASKLPLQQGLSATSCALDESFEAMVIGAREHGGGIRAKVGIFFSGLVAGCSCADDPTPLEAQSEYCVLRFDIDRATGEVAVVLDDD